MNGLETACIESLRGRQLEIGDQFYMKKFNKPKCKPMDDKEFNEAFGLPMPPVAPPIPKADDPRYRPQKAYDLPDLEDCNAAIEVLQHALKIPPHKHDKAFTLKFTQGYEAYFGLTHQDGLTFLKKWLDLP